MNCPIEALMEKTDVVVTESMIFNIEINKQNRGAKVLSEKPQGTQPLDSIRNHIPMQC